MDELKLKAGEKIGALHEAAKTAAGTGRSRVEDAVNHTVDVLNKIREAFNDIWHHELIAEGRDRIAAWTRDAAQRIRDGTPPLSPVLLYEELVALFTDRVWRRSMVIFACGLALGGGCGLAVGLRCGTHVPSGPHARALHAQNDQSVILVEDATAPGVVLDVGYGVGHLELGDEVWGCVSEWSGGAATELLTIRSTRVSKRPHGLAADAAASLPWAGGLALRALERLRCTSECKGKRMVICGAASGEGCALIQLLTARGAHVSVLAPRRARNALQNLGAHEYVELDANNHSTAPWAALAQHGGRAGPWDGVLACGGAGAPAAGCAPARAALKATAARDAVVELRPTPLITDRLPIPLSVMFAASFYTFRVLRWVLGCGTHTDWLEEKQRLADGLTSLASLVNEGTLRPVLDKVYLPEDFEAALAHACSDEALGTTVIRFP
ncbi:reticulon-4-interacting protein 1, mitochondrial-like isoform X2 [Cydia pomonella]|uniref:reticulon-4-interacting protein 1, mitochondrial-like isoform X2 n=1 Tax=Cydia pomonella TaxID=82600 RepID=UPI002ADD3B75|nr:reticulon-4-interacting protein 1, mitochondrial-like isoform X2 [Cydia pomonella]